MSAPVAVALLAYAVVILAVAWRGRSDGRLDYLLAGRRLTTWPFVATLVSTWYGGVLGVGEYSFRFGVSNWLVFGVPYYLAATGFALFFAARVRASNMRSIPDQLAAAYGTLARRVGAVLVLLVAIPAAYTLMLGELLGIYLDVPLAWAVVAGTVFTIGYVWIGGFRSVVDTNAVQFVLMFLSFAILLPVAVAAAGGFSAMWQALPATHRSWDGGLGVQAVVVWYFIALQTLVEPTFYQRCYAARSPDVARRGVLVSVAFWVLYDFLTTFTGLAARVLLPATSDPVLAYPALGHALLPPVADALFAVGLFATVMSTAHSYLFLGAATIGHDIVPELARRIDERRWTMAGLVLVGGASIALALTLRSVVAIWHDVGSVVTAALLVPLAATHLPPRWRPSAVAAVAAMVLAGGTAAAWILARGTGGTYLLGVEPIFPALAVSLTCVVADRLVGRIRRSGP